MAQSFFAPVIRYGMMMHGIASKNELRKKNTTEEDFKSQFQEKFASSFNSSQDMVEVSESLIRCLNG